MTTTTMQSEPISTTHKGVPLPPRPGAEIHRELLAVAVRSSNPLF